MKLGTMVTGLITVIIALVVVLNIYGETTTEVKAAGNTINQTNQCTDAGCYYNATAASTARCQVADGDITPCATGQHTASLQGLFSGNGVVLLIFLAAILVTTLAVAMKAGKQ